MIEDFEDRVAEKMLMFQDALETLSGSKKKLMEDSAYDYCRVCVMLDDVTANVLEQGTAIMNEKGRVERNPEVMTMHQMMNEKNALLPKLLKHISGNETTETDDLADFIRS